MRRVRSPSSVIGCCAGRRLRRPQLATDLLRSGSHGLPFVACVSQLGAESLGLAAGSDIPPASVERLARSTSALFTSAYGAETHLVWLVDRADATESP
jgi:hypothetical protein